MKKEEILAMSKKIGVDEGQEINLSKKNKNSVGIYSTLGAGIGLLVGLMFDNLSLSLIFGFAIGVIIDSIVYSNKK